MFEVNGTPRGSERARSHGRSRFHSIAHVKAMDAFVIAARAGAAKVRWQCAAEPVRVLIETYHRRPQSAAKARKHWGTPSTPFRGKPDADNVAKLVMDACTAAGVWTDDTVVAQLEVRRWWTAVGEDGTQEVERTVVQVEAL